METNWTHKICSNTQKIEKAGNKRKRSLVEHKTVSDIILKPTRKWILLVFTETPRELERQKMK